MKPIALVLLTLLALAFGSENTTFRVNLDRFGYTTSQKASIVELFNKTAQLASAIARFASDTCSALSAESDVSRGMLAVAMLVGGDNFSKTASHKHFLSYAALADIFTSLLRTHCKRSPPTFHQLLWRCHFQVLWR